MLTASPFDSEIYGYRVARLVPSGPDDVDAGLAEARGNFDVVFVRVDGGDLGTATRLGERGVAPLETLVTSELAPDAAASPVPVVTAVTVEEHARIDDAREIATIAGFTGDAIRTSHYHADDRLPVTQTRTLYARWMENDLRGRALTTFVVRQAQRPVGALTIVKAGEGRVAIDLVAVDPSAQGQGIGGALVGAFITWVRARNLVGRVGTQADNRALALYHRCGFVPVERAQTYHVWLS